MDGAAIIEWSHHKVLGKYKLIFYEFLILKRIYTFI